MRRSRLYWARKAGTRTVMVVRAEEVAIYSWEMLEGVTGRTGQ